MQKVSLKLAVVAATLVTQIAASAAQTTEVWVGAPANGIWPAPCFNNPSYPTSTCSLPLHHWDYDSDNNGKMNDGDWSVDLSINAGTDVFLYVAPQVTTKVITTKVERVSDACVAPRNGAKMVRVGVYDGSTRIGQLIYSHLTAGTTPAVGAVPRWGTKLGTVAYGLPSDSNCWTAPHIHFEMYNQVNYACYSNRSPASSFSSTNWIGFLGGNRVSGPRKPCP